MIAWEIKKMFKSRNGIIALILLCILSMSMVFIKPKLEININNNSVSITAEEEYRIKIQELEKASKNKEKDEFSMHLQRMASDKLKAMKFDEYKDVRFWQVFSYRSTHGLMIFIMIVIIPILFTNIYTDEIISGVDSLILSSRNKNRVLYSKLALSIGLPIMLYAGYLIVQFIITLIQYGKPINSDLQVLRIVDTPLLLKGTYTIHQFLLIKIGIMLMVFITLAIIASLVSYISKNSTQSISGFLGFMFLGKVITLIKWLPKSVLAILSKTNYIDLLSNFNKSILMYDGGINILSMNLDTTNLCVAVIIATFILGIFSCVISFNKYLTR